MREEKIPPHEAKELALCFDAHARDLFGYACVLVRGDRALADDLVQAAFHAASLDWRTLRRLAEDQRHGWLRAALANIAIGWFRGEHGEAAARDRLPAAEVSRGRAQAGQAGQPGQAFSPVTLERCWQVIQSMPEPQHAAALLHWLLDLKEDEIAAALRMADKTVSAHLHRARRKLIAQLGPENPYTGDDPDGAS
ncbi:MAG: RNA polymerase sigma factor [Streptosporangiaceae bacterium]